MRLWREPWYVATERREALESQGASGQELKTLITDTLRDAYRSRTPPKFTAEQVVQIVAIAGEDP